MDLPAFDADGLRHAPAVIASYRVHQIGLTQASIAVRAERQRTRATASLDRRRFDALRPPRGGCFELLPRAG